MACFLAFYKTQFSQTLNNIFEIDLGASLESESNAAVTTESMEGHFNAITGLDAHKRLPLIASAGEDKEVFV